jgi:hypothetical protein
MHRSIVRLNEAVLTEQQADLDVRVYTLCPFTVRDFRLFLEATENRTMVYILQLYWVTPMFKWSLENPDRATTTE